MNNRIQDKLRISSLKFLLFVFSVSTVFTSCTTTYYIVRHAEKADVSKDPLLSDIGNARATALKDILLITGIDYIFVSDMKRTQETVAPLALVIKNKPIIIAATTAGTQQLMRWIYHRILNLSRQI